MPSAVGGPHGGRGDLRVQPVGDVLDRAAGVQVRRPPHPDPLAVGRDVVHRVPGVGDHLGGRVVQRDPDSPPVARSRRRLVERPARRPCAGRRRRPRRDGGRRPRPPPVDDDDAQVLAGTAPRRGRRGRTAAPASTARSSPASSRTPTVMPRPCSPRAGFTTTAPTSAISARASASSPSPARTPAGDPDAGALHDPAGHPLVVAAAHRHGGGELRQRLAGDHGPAADRRAAARPTRRRSPRPRMPRRSASSAMISA